MNYPSRPAGCTVRGAAHSVGLLMRDDFIHCSRFGFLRVLVLRKGSAGLLRDKLCRLKEISPRVCPNRKHEAQP